jgi:PAS domain S-box-containing protein
MTGGADAIRVLCVDDDPPLLDLLANFLERVDPRLDVSTVDTPPEALSQIGPNSSVDCVVSDFDMPEMNGLELFEAVRRQDPELPFILYTGKGSEEIASEAISAGVTDYLQKDSGIEHYELLANRICEYVERYRTGRQHDLAAERYRRLVEQSVVGIGLSQDGVFRYANPKMAEMFGYTVEELVGMPALALVDESDRERVERAIQRREDGEVDSVHYVITGKRKDGERFDVEVNGSRIIYEGEPAILGVLQPLDTRQRALATVRGSVVEELVESLESAVADLDQVGTPDEFVADAQQTLLDALTALRTEAVVDLATRCRQTWASADRPAANLSIEGTLAVVGDGEEVNRLLETLWAQWDDDERPLEAALSVGNHSFEVAVEPGTAESFAESHPHPAALSRVAEALGWDAYVREDDGGVVYGFENVSVVPSITGT